MTLEHRGKQHMHALVVDTLVGALGLGARELVSLVGAGGKSTALQRLCRELVASGSTVIAATTTAMFLSQMADLGPVFTVGEGGDLVTRLRKALVDGRTAAVAQSLGDGGKVVGVPSPVIDRLWAEGLADYFLVEADGSRGMPLKAFGRHEPQVPAATTTIVEVAGLDALGTALTAEHVHRAQTFATMLSIPIGSLVTERVFADGLRMQLAQLRQTNAGARVVLLLNKADGPRGPAMGLAVARLLEDDGLASTMSSERGRLAVADQACADSVVIASLYESRFTLATSEG
jgi:molybdenum cofactor cytidylyltransferase